MNDDEAEAEAVSQIVCSDCGRRLSQKERLTGPGDMCFECFTLHDNYDTPRTEVVL